MATPDCKRRDGAPQARHFMGRAALDDAGLQVGEEDHGVIAVKRGMAHDFAPSSWDKATRISSAICSPLRLDSATLQEAPASSNRVPGTASHSGSSRHEPPLARSAAMARQVAMKTLMAA